jgi:hypothetical protein
VDLVLLLQDRQHGGKLVDLRARAARLSACFSANAICSSLYLDFFISSSSPAGSQKPKLPLGMDEKREDVSHITPSDRWPAARTGSHQMTFRHFNVVPSH